MKALIKKKLLTFVLLSVSTVTFAQTTVFGHWASENGHEIYIHSTSNFNHFPYSQDTDCYGGIALVSEINECGEYYIFNKIAGENGKLSIKYTKVKALDGEKIEKGKLEAVLDNGNVIINGNDELSNIVFENREVYNEDINDGAFTAEEFFAILIPLLIVIALFGSLIHMIYILTRRKHFPQAYSVVEIKKMRVAAGKPAEASYAENREVYNILGMCFDTWKPYIDDNGKEQKVAVNRKMVDATEACINRCLEIMPTDRALVDSLNEVCELVNANWARSFSGNKMLIGITVVLAVIMAITGGLQAVPFFVLSLAIYILSCYKPIFMHNKDAFKTRGTLSAGCLAAVFGFIASAQTVRTVTKWSDGTRTVEDDHSQHWIFLIIGLAILAMIAFFLALWGFFNYLRNYILYM